jgi:hypothetical protein
MAESTTTQRRAALRLLAQGDATVAEVAGLIGSSRQRVAYWATSAGIDPIANRDLRLEQLWQEASVVARIVAAKPARAMPRRKRSRQEENAR